MRGRPMLAAGIVLASLLLGGCANPQPQVDVYNGLAVVSRNNDVIFLRGASCLDEQPITGFRLTPTSSTAEPLVWPITPDQEAVVRVGTVDELGVLLGDDEWVLTIDGVDEPIVELLITMDDIEAMQVADYQIPDLPGAGPPPDPPDYRAAIQFVCARPESD